jgi:Family of unknown function (DUF6459)
MTSAISEDLLDTLRRAAPRDGRPYLTPVPDCEPPYDDLPPLPQPAAFRPALLPQAPAGIGLKAASAAEAERRSHGSLPTLSVAHADTMPAAGQSVAPAHAPAAVTGSAPAARSIAGAAARILIEALCGARPVRQLAGTCAAPVLTALGRRVRVGGSIPRLMSVHVAEPAPRVAEVAAIYRDRDRVAALAFRLETVGDRWRVTELQLA